MKQQTLSGLPQEMPRQLVRRNVFAHNRSEIPAHHWYTLVAGFSGDFVTKILRDHNIGPGDVVLDPFVGSGTTALASIVCGAQCLGIEANPFSHLVAMAKTNPNLGRREVRSDVANVERELAALLSERVGFRWKSVPTTEIRRHLSSIRGREDGPPEMPHLYRWMSPRVVGRVLALKKKLWDLRDSLSSPDSFDLVKVALGSVLIPVSNMELAGPKIRYRRKNGSRILCTEAPVAKLFARKLRSMVEGVLPFSPKRNWVRPDLRREDARRVDLIFEHRVSIAVTSPPYLNEVDYLENSRLQLYFLDLVRSELEFRSLKEGMIRANSKYLFKSNRDYPHNLPGLPAFDEIIELARRIRKNWVTRSWGWDHPRLVVEYFIDMAKHLAGVRRLMASGGRYIMVVGDSAIDGVLVQTDTILARIAAEVGFSQSTVSPFRWRGSSRHGTGLRESIVTLTA